MAMIFSYRWQNGFLNSLNPLSKLLLLISLCFPLTGGTPVYTFALFALLLITILAIRMPLHLYKRALGFFLFTAAMIFLFQLRATGDITASLTPAIRFLSFVAMGMIYSDTTDPSTLSRTLRRFIGTKSANTIELTLSLIPTVFKVSEKVHDAQTARLATIRRPVRYLTLYATGIIGELFNTLDEMAFGLESRLFEQRTAQEPVPFTKKDVLFLILGALLTAAGYIW